MLDRNTAAARWKHKHYGDVYFDRPSQVMGCTLYVPEILTMYRVHNQSHHLNNISVKIRDDADLYIRWMQEKYRHTNHILSSLGFNNLEIKLNIRLSETL